MQEEKTALIRRFGSGKVILIIGAVLLLSSIGDRALLGSEGRWAVIVREMFNSGDFFHPTIGGEPYFDKPLLSYWAIAACSAIVGQLNEFILRLPSALAALITLGCTMYLGKNLWSRHVGKIAGCLLITSYGLLEYANVASAETGNMAAIMLAVVWYWSRRQRPGFVSFLVFYSIMLVGAHIKGLTALAVPIIVVLPDLLRERRWRWLLWPSHWLALGIGLCVYLAPFVYAAINQPDSYGQSGLYMVFRENIQRFVQPFDHKGPIYLYLESVPLLTLPWTPILIAALITLVTHWKKLDYHTRWLVQATLLIFVLFTLSGSRRSYYILPILPFCMLLTAVFLAEIKEEIAGKNRTLSLRLLIFALTSTAALEVVLGPVAVWVLTSQFGWALPQSLYLSFISLGLLALLMGAGTYKLSGAVWSRSQLRTTWTLIVMAGIIQGGFFMWQGKIFDLTGTERPFTLRLKETIASLPNDRIAFWHQYEDKMLFYLELDPPITMLSNESDLQAFLKIDRPGIVISQDRYMQGTVASMLPSEPTYAEAVYAWESTESQKEKLKAWLVNQDMLQTVAAIGKDNHAQ